MSEIKSKGRPSKWDELRLDVTAASKCLETAIEMKDWDQVVLAERFLQGVLQRLQEGRQLTRVQ